MDLVQIKQLKSSGAKLEIYMHGRLEKVLCLLRFIVKKRKELKHSLTGILKVQVWFALLLS